MEELGKIHQLIVPLFGHNMVFNLEVIFMTWIVIAILILFGIATTRKKSMLPGSLQVIGELFVAQLYDLTEDALDRKLAKTYAPLIFALFLFLVLGNWIGMVPHLGEPTKDLNTPLSLGLMALSLPTMPGSKARASKRMPKSISNRFFS